VTTFELAGTPAQNAVAQAALARCTFPFDVLSVDRIPVEWADLSRYAATVAEGKASGGHAHVHENGDTGHPVEARERVLGLAWYSGRVTLDTSLETDPTLAGEVLLSEGAHMLDFFWMTDRRRMVIYNALHPEAEDLPLDTNVEDGVPIDANDPQNTARRPDDHHNRDRLHPQRPLPQILRCAGQQSGLASRRVMPEAFSEVPRVWCAYPHGWG